MKIELTAVLEAGDDPQHVLAFCPEIPEANGQGCTREETLDDLRAAIALALDVRRNEALKGISSQTKPNSPPSSGSSEASRPAAVAPAHGCRLLREGTRHSM